MTTIIYWKQGTVINVMTAADAVNRDRQAQLVEKFWREGKTKEEAINLARHEIPDPTVISFATDRQADLSSHTGAYGHAGYEDLYKQLLRVSNIKVTTRVMRLRNLEEWNLPTPTEADIRKVFGEPAVAVFREYRRQHGLS